MATAPAPSGKKENVFTRKIGPLPTWAWTAIIGGVILLWAFYQRSKANSQAAAATSASTVPPDVFMVSPNGTQTTPPSTDDDDDGKKKKKTPDHHHRRHKTRKHPAEDEHGGRSGQEGSFTTNRAATLQQVANARHWTPQMLAAVEKEDKLKAGSKLRKGQTIRTPWQR